MRSARKNRKAPDGTERHERAERSPSTVNIESPKTEFLFAKALLIGVAGALLAFAATWSGCGDDPEKFIAVEFEKSGAVVQRNEDLRIVFSRKIGRETPLRSLVHVRDASGRELAINLRQSDRSIVVRPADGYGWPANHTLTLQLERGHAAAFRSADGTPLAEDFSWTFEVAGDYIDLGEPMTIESGADGVETEVTRDSVFSLRFSLPIDPTSLRGTPPAVEVRYESGNREFKYLTPEFAVESDGCTLSIRPWTANSEFYPGTRHQILIHRRIRSVTGRELVDETAIPFVTSATAEIEGVLDVGFALEDCEGFDPSRRPLDRRYAGPVLAPVRAEVLNDDRPGSGVAHPSPWSVHPSRLQFRVPASRMSEEPGLITGISWMSVDPVPAGVIFPRVIIRIGDLLPGQKTLGRDFDKNYAALADGASSAEGFLETVPKQNPRSGTRIGGAWAPIPDTDARWQKIEFERPFYFRGDGRDLLIEVVNELGAQSDGQTPLPADFRGLTWRGRSDPALPGIQSIWSANTSGQSVVEENLVFATKIHIERYLEFESKWYQAKVDHPAYSILPTGDHIIGEGVENEDFRFLFKGKAGEYEPATDWLPFVRKVDGMKWIKVKVVFLHNSGRDPERIEVRRLRLRYKTDR